MAMILNDLPSRGDAFSVHKGINHDELVRLTCSAGSGASDGRQTPAEASCPLKDLRTVPVFELNRRNQIRIAANHSKRTGGRAHIGITGFAGACVKTIIACCFAGIFFSIPRPPNLFPAPVYKGGRFGGDFTAARTTTRKKMRLNMIATARMSCEPKL